MNARFEPLHQPPDPGDLQRHPPLEVACARVRGLLRDFVDGDLDGALMREVEEHVHGCRVCGLALARAEHEVLRLRRTLGAEAGAEQPAPGFARRTVERLLVETAPNESGPNEPGDGAAAPAQRSRLRWSLPWVLALAATSTAAAAVSGFLFWQHQISITVPARFSVVRADRASTREGARLSPGDGYGEGTVIVVKNGGSTVLDCSDQTSGNQPAAQITLRGDGELCMHGGLPLLVEGTMEVKSHRPMAVNLGD